MVNPVLAPIKLRENARIERSALDEVRAIQTLLDDVYKDAGDGRTLIRELVQNADDAGAERLVFTVLDRGLSNASNSLLHGPALLVANDGPFRERDWDAIHRAIGGSKTEDAGKVGRFGVGLKSAFHVCEALVYIGAENDVCRGGVLNPWAGTGNSGDSDPIHPDWDSVKGEDVKNHLLRLASNLLGGFRDGLLLWIPLRQPAHLDRAEDRLYGLGKTCASPDSIREWFQDPDGLSLLLAQCGHLRSIEAIEASDEGRMIRSLIRVERPDFERKSWVGRPTDDQSTSIRWFEGEVHCGEVKWEAQGVETLGGESLRQLRDQPDWPHEQEWVNGVLRTVPRKAVGHAAITILRTASRQPDRSRAHLRWAVFFPLDNNPEPRSSTAVESSDLPGSPDNWEVVLHGYFWPSHDRRSIPGVTINEDGDGEGAIRTEWNQKVRDELLLPLLPSILASATARVNDSAAHVLVRALARSNLITAHRDAITHRDVLLPLVTTEGVRFEVRSSGCRTISIPEWESAPAIVRVAIVDLFSEGNPDFELIHAEAPRIGGDPNEWAAEWLDCLLRCIPADALKSMAGVRWAGLLVRHVLGRYPKPEDERAAVIADWLGECIGNRVLSPTTGQDDIREELRGAWRQLFLLLPNEWLLEAPVDAQTALEELAGSGLVGRGLLPIPLGLGSLDIEPRLEQRRLDRALLELGRKLAGGTNESKNRQRSRLLLAERLLATRDGEGLEEELAELPLLRAHRLPDGEDEPWSLQQLKVLTENKRVFSKPGEVSNPDTVVLPDFRRAVHDLATALGTDLWLVEHDVARFSGAPMPRPEELAATVLASEEIKSTPTTRLPLVQRFAKVADRPEILDALRAILSGPLAALEADDLYFVRTRDSERAANERSLAILLGRLAKTWRAVDAFLAEDLTQKLCDDLGLRPVDSRQLHLLLSECLQGEVDWTGLQKAEVLHLLERLYGREIKVRENWHAMPVHRRVDGSRGPIDKQTVRALGSTSIPPGLISEVTLLNPDPEVEHLYDDVQKLDDERILQLMLASSHPNRFARPIIQSVHADSGESVMIPRNPEIRDLLGRAEWLPGKDGSGISPERLLLIPPELRDGIEALAAGGVIGEYRLSSDVEGDVWGEAKPVVHEVLRRPGPAMQLRRIADAVGRDQIGELERGAYLILSHPDHVSAELIGDVLQTPVAGKLPGWSLLHAAVRMLGDSTELTDMPTAARDAVLALARSLCAPLPAQRQIEMLQAVAAGRPPRDSPGGRVFRVLLDHFAGDNAFFTDVLPHLILPTQDGQWHPATEIAKSTSGLARRHLLLIDLRSSLRLDNDESVLERADSRPTHGIDGADIVIWPIAPVLVKYFNAWRGRVPESAVGAFLSLLGNGQNDEILNLAGKWLGEDISIEGVREPLTRAAWRLRFSNVRISAGTVDSGATHIKLLNIIGERVEMEVGKEQATIFATDPVRGITRYGDSWEILFRDVEPQHKTAPELTDLLGKTIEWWGGRVLGLDLDTVRAWWSRWGQGSQAQVEPVRASILAYLPLTLRQLDVSENSEFQQALRDAEGAQRRREQAPDSQQSAALGLEKNALSRLADLVRQDAHQDFIWQRVQEQMRRFGYRPDSVLLELAQNADDALAQAAEIAGSELPADVRRLVIRFDRTGDNPFVDVLHFGRPINDTGGPRFPAGRDRQWDQDLYFMMLLNLSGKPGEVLGRSSSSSTTGRFGLGFKSVHLVSAAPEVVSGFLAFSIVGGLLPEEETLPDEADLAPVQGHRATRIRLPLREDIDADKLIEDLLARFGYARALIPVFARQIREVIVDGGPQPGVGDFTHQAIDGAAGWVVSSQPTELPGHGQWRVLRFRPADKGAGTGTVALAFGLRDGRPTPFPKDLPFLWNVTPTSESWGCGYAVNGPFKLDPGRTHVSLDDPDTVRLVDMLGEELGKGLIALHDAIMDEAGSTNSVPFIDDGPAFISALWEVLSTGAANADTLRRGVLDRLHGSERGLTVWMEARAVVPTGMPAPFPQRLPPLERVRNIEVAASGLDDPEFCRALATVDGLTGLIGDRCVVTQPLAERLRPFVETSMSDLHPATLLATLTNHWGQRLTPERLHVLQPFASDKLWKLISTVTDGDPWSAKLTAMSAAGVHLPLRQLLLPRDLLDGGDSDVEEELWRAAFAPDSAVLAPGYIIEPDDLVIFRRLRGGYQIDAVTMAGWCADLPSDRWDAALRYLLHGKLHKEVLERIVPEASRPEWLTDYDTVENMLNALTNDVWRRESLLAALFPRQYENAHEEEHVWPESVKSDFFILLEAWWDEPETRRDVVSAYEARIWPEWLLREGLAERLKENSRDHWLALLVLGACQSLGRTQPSQHRGFIQRLKDEGWWEVFKDADRPAAWMEVLRFWQDRSAENLDYAQWMSLFPTIYQLSRFLDVYQQLLKSAGRRPDELYNFRSLLAPRMDQALTGAGQQFDAPPAPLHMGKHWILRELVRLQIIPQSSSHVLSDCWVPGEQVIMLLRPLGLTQLDPGADNVNKARTIFDFLAVELETPSPHLHYSFDIPLRHIEETPDLKIDLGLEA